jgi:L-asparaginase/Glu-tRNA(Gln) amidotransferase subunit D
VTVGSSQARRWVRKLSNSRSDQYLVHCLHTSRPGTKVHIHIVDTFHEYKQGETATTIYDRVKIQDNRETNQYFSVEDVPTTAYRDILDQIPSISI